MYIQVTKDCILEEIINILYFFNFRTSVWISWMQSYQYLHYLNSDCRSCVCCYFRNDSASSDARQS